jgi:hypothetical protein
MLLQTLDNVESANKKHKVLHTVMPSPDKNKDKNKDEYASYYILIEDKVLLQFSN